MTMGQRLAQRRWNEGSDFGYWKEVFELEYGRRLTLHETQELATFCLSMRWEDADDQWGFDELEDLMNEFDEVG